MEYRKTAKGWSDFVQKKKLVKEISGVPVAPDSDDFPVNDPLEGRESGSSSLQKRIVNNLIESSRLIKELYYESDLGNTDFLLVAYKNIKEAIEQLNNLSSETNV